MDPVLVRAAFIASCFLAGITAILYPILWIALPEKGERKKKRKLSIPYIILGLIKIVFKLALKPILWLLSSKKEEPPKQNDVSSLAPQKKVCIEQKTDVMSKKPEEELLTINIEKSFMGKFLGFLAFCFLAVFFYIPAIILVLGVASYIVWGIFYPIITLGSFQLSFAQLQIPGITMASFAAALLISLFLLIVTFMARLHFKSKVLGKNSLFFTIVLLIISIFGCVSSGAMIAFENKTGYTSTTVKKFALKKDKDIIIGKELFNNINKSTLKINYLKIRSENDCKEIIVRCFKKARGLNDELARMNEKKIFVRWQTKGDLFPLIKKPEKGFHFEEVYLEMIVPSDRNITLSGSPNFKVIWEGKFEKSVTLDMIHSHMNFSDITANILNLKTQDCNTFIEAGSFGKIDVKSEKSTFMSKNMKCQTFQFNGNKGFTYLRNLSGAHINLQNKEGNMVLKQSQGVLNIENKDGKIRLYRHNFLTKSKNILKNTSGKFRIFLRKDNTPQIHVKNKEGVLQNRVKKLPTSDSVVELSIEKGFVSLYQH